MFIHCKLILHPALTRRQEKGAKYLAWIYLYLGNIANNPQFELHLAASDQKKNFDVVVALMKNEKKSESKGSIGNITFEIYDVN